jgi:hypothetical protein
MADCYAAYRLYCYAPRIFPQCFIGRGIDRFGLCNFNGLIVLRRDSNWSANLDCRRRKMPSRLCERNSPGVKRGDFRRTMSAAKSAAMVDKVKVLIPRLDCRLVEVGQILMRELLYAFIVSLYFTRCFLLLGARRCAPNTKQGCFVIVAQMLREGISA